MTSNHNMSLFCYFLITIVQGSNKSDVRNCLQMRKDDEDADISRDWKFAAMVVDRLCLIIFTLFTIIATLAVLLSAPHIMVS